MVDIGLILFVCYNFIQCLTVFELYSFVRRFISKPRQKPREPSYVDLTYFSLSASVNEILYEVHGTSHVLIKGVKHFSS
ncbi:uncharacterized protein PHALS_15116 [Plasmopara halstedii]|uniref:Uncharacterized protein n=1 Tax=Plasmopara halstedii TaxID=4781 RepID=A0A0N7L462_PLAHL|nr:uncharacterized protein PHALS_15116 [Plasmopara halstedii]CEG37787.1 hypothetical protein PHALS_15116 [Plasmopara halstedii]|eukprot:XP_024574156.1 hypothetical protein PHALS_15116 [Plasmopara halstedii]